MSLDYFWSLDPKQYDKHIEVYIETETSKVKFYDQLMHTMGSYILTAFNNPKEYPEVPFHQQDTTKEQTEDDMERMARRNTIMMGGEIK